MTDHGYHILADLFEVCEDMLKDETLIEKILLESANIANAHVLNVFTHKFGGAGGVTSLVALAESHISIHTWPESRLATIDVYMCGSGKPELAIEFIKSKFCPKVSEIKILKRGGLEEVVRS